MPPRFTATCSARSQPSGSRQQVAESPASVANTWRWPRRAAFNTPAHSHWPRSWPASAALGGYAAALWPRSSPARRAEQLRDRVAGLRTARDLDVFMQPRAARRAKPIDHHQAWPLHPLPDVLQAGGRHAMAWQICAWSTAATAAGPACPCQPGGRPGGRRLRAARPAAQSGLRKMVAAPACSANRKTLARVVVLVVRCAFVGRDVRSSPAG